MTKVAIKSENITSFGGIFHVMDTFSKTGLGKLIESTLGQRGSTGKAFQYSDILSSVFYSYLCGADCLEDINTLAPQFSMAPGTVHPSSDTVGRGLKELKTDNEIYTCESSCKEYRFNTAERLNQLLLKMIGHLGLIKEGTAVDMDFDHQFIPAHKYDAEYSYKGDYGYFPGWATVGGIFVGGENRDGNANVKFHQADTLDRIMTRMEDILKVTVNRFRADCGSFSKEIIRTVEKHCNLFYIRASNCADRYEELHNHAEWESAEIGHEKCGLASLAFNDFIEGKTYRLVVQRTPKKDRDGKIEKDMFGIVYVYRCIITNDWESSEKDIVTFYNKRGESEKNFDVQNNDFGWAHLPFSFLEENTVFMLVTAMLKNFYLYMLGTLTDRIKPLGKTSRLKSFMLHFICVPAKWIRTGRRHVLNLYTTKDYYSDIFRE
jgi:hypothetical protein